MAAVMRDKTNDAGLTMLNHGLTNPF